MLAISSGSPAQASIGGTFSSLTLFAIDDSGDITFVAGISGGITTFAVFRYHPSTSQLDIVAYNGEAAPGSNITTFASLTVTLPSTPPTTNPLPAFRFIAMANDGRVTFLAALSQGGNAVYQQTGTALPAPVVIASLRHLPEAEPLFCHRVSRSL